MSKDNEMPEKAHLKSLDISAENRARLKQLFPSVFIETKDENGEVVESVDFEKLKAELGTFSDVFEARRERYGMDWPGKKDCMKLIQKPSIATLKPCREESVNFDKTENLFIEGDNLEVLKLLQKSYYGKIKMIYIDPPYNTGKEFIYPDDYSESLDTYLAYAGLIDDEGKKFSTNTLNEGRFHTKWLNMMYPRIYLARNLLSESGAIFISISDHEVVNLTTICNDIFGEENRVATLVWEKKKKGAFLAGSITNIKEYIIIYCKNHNEFSGLIGEIASEQETYPVIKTTNARGTRVIRGGIASKFRERNHIEKSGTRISSGNMELILLSDLVIKDGVLQKDLEVDSNWIYSQQLLDEYAEAGDLYVTQDLYFRRIVNDPREKRLKDILQMVGTSGESGKRFVLSDNLYLDGWGTNEDGFDELHELIGYQNIMDFPKPSKLLAKLILAFCREDKDCTILDFFAGSCTTAHALLDLNRQDGGHRNFMMVQLPEPCEDDSEAAKAGYKTISDIGKDRIRRVISTFEEEHKAAVKSAKGDLIQSQEEHQNITPGFKVLKLYKSNFKIWGGSEPEPTDEKIAKQLEAFVEHIDPKATQEDILFELLLKAGFKPTEKIEKKTFAEKTVFYIADGLLLICLEDEITKELIEAIAEAEPLQFICLDRGFKGNDQLKANAVQTFAARNQGRDKQDQIVFRTV